MFSGPDGEWVLRDICRHGFVNKPTFVAGDPNQIYLNEGSRRLALSIVHFTKGDISRIIDQLNKQKDAIPVNEI